MKTSNNLIRNRNITKVKQRRKICEHIVTNETVYNTYTPIDNFEDWLKNLTLQIDFIDELNKLSLQDLQELIPQLICTIRVYKQDKMREALWNDDHTK